jgi:hypothetical protein
LRLGDDQVGPYALALAKEFGAHSTAVAYAFEPSLPYFAADSLGDVVAQARDAAGNAAAQDLAQFESHAKQTGLNVVVTKLVASTERVAREPAHLARRSFMTDIATVVGGSVLIADIDGPMETICPASKH